MKPLRAKRGQKNERGDPSQKDAIAPGAPPRPKYQFGACMAYIKKCLSRQATSATADD